MNPRLTSPPSNHRNEALSDDAEHGREQRLCADALGLPHPVFVARRPVPHGQGEPVSTRGWPVRLLAAQLRQPSGPLGLLVARRLNRNNRDMVRAAVEASGAAQGQRVADVGFGGGSGLALLLARVSPDGRVGGVDVSRTMVARARVLFRRPIARGSLFVGVGAANALPFATALLDAVITVNTVYFLPHLEPVFRECARVLRPGGRLVVCLGDPVEMAELPVTAHRFLLRPVPEVQAALRSAGLVVDGHRLLGRRPASFHVLTARRP